ncbi:MAG: sulfotransferase [Phycisphaerales bacterium]|nr:sulfotransferase [Phycisphaerales bacterium]
MTLQPPIIIVGATRSGTTMLMRVLGSAPGLCFWHEPQTLWRVGHAYRDHDCAGAADARPWVRRWIRRQFFKYQEHHGGLRVVEKSPTNVLRIPFVRKIFPEARIIHIYRDGRANLRSQVEQYHTFAGYKVINREGGRHILHRLEETPFWEWPAYMPRAAAGLVRRYVTRRPGVRWFGVKYPGWRHDLRTMTTAQIAAKQWVISVETAMRDLAEVPPEQWLGLVYRDVVTDPDHWFRKIAEFCGVEINEEYMKAVRAEVHPNSLERWKRELEPGVLDEALPIMGPLLDRLGYAPLEPDEEPAGVGTGTAR